MGDARRACTGESTSKGHALEVGQEGRQAAKEGTTKVSVYKRGDVWWYKFRFAGQMIRETSKSNSKTVAKDAERVRRRELEQGFNRIEKQRVAQLFSVAAEDWLAAKKAHLAQRSVIIERANLKHPESVLRQDAGL